jgi:hypothetical protein
MEKHFVIFFSPGTFVAETTEKPIESWDVDKATEMARSIKERYDATPYGFCFTTRARKDDELDSKEVKRSGMYYLGGKVLTLAEVKDQMPEERTLIGNMECNKWDRILINTNSWKWTQPLTDKDTVLSFNG